MTATATFNHLTIITFEFNPLHNSNIEWRIFTLSLRSPTIMIYNEHIVISTGTANNVKNMKLSLFNE